MTETKMISETLQRVWQPPAPSTDAAARIIARAANTPQAAPVAPRRSARPVLWLAAAASFAAVLMWNGTRQTNAPTSNQYAETDALDEAALSFLYSNQSEEELL